MLALLGLVLQATTSAPCPDLSGRYLIPGEDGAVTVIIEQMRCEKVTIQWNIRSEPDSSLSRHGLALTGKFQLDTDWFGASRLQLTAARFVADTLLLSTRPAFATSASPPFIAAKFRIIAGGICTAFQYRSDEAPVWTFAGRIRRGHLITEDEKADGDFRCGQTRGRPNTALLLPGHASEAAGSLRSPAASLLMATWPQGWDRQTRLKRVDAWDKRQRVGTAIATIVVVGGLVTALWLSRNRPLTSDYDWEARECRSLYARSRSSADSSLVDVQEPQSNPDMPKPRMNCRELRLAGKTNK
jgi:hypothetical protein